VDAEALYARITRFNSDYYEGSRGPGQIAKTVVALGENLRASRYCIVERKEGLRNCDCVTNR
jgi:hypothetical protein